MSMTKRFLRKRWSRTRRRMDRMKPGAVLRLPRKEYFNAHASTFRLNDAYAGERQWTLQRQGPVLIVKCQSGLDSPSIS